MDKPNYYANIPATVRYDKRLSPNAKLLYGEITALCNREGYCWATNQYFSTLYEVSTRSITNWLHSLIENGYIQTELIYKEGSKEVDKRLIRLPIENFFRPYGNNFPTPIEKNFQDNNTLSNTTINKEIYSSIVDYLNEKVGSNYKVASKKTKDLIKARVNEGFELDDFKTVIDIKVAEWANDSNMSKFLRPETLFSNKFEGYLNQKPKQEKRSTYNKEMLW